MAHLAVGQRDNIPSVADDLFDRVISVGLNQWYTARDCRNIARGVNKVLSAYCTEDPKARAWV